MKISGRLDTERAILTPIYLTGYRVGMILWIEIATNWSLEYVCVVVLSSKLYEFRFGASGGYDNPSRTLSTLGTLRPSFTTVNKRRVPPVAVAYEKMSCDLLGS